MRILVTNDDGVRAPGLAVLALALSRAGHDVIAIAPHAEASGSGAGVGPLHTMGSGLAYERLDLPGLTGVETIGVEALPALIVISACMGAFGPAPDMVVSGINPGRNIGRSVLHSGTVGAALTATHFDRSGLAMSIQSGGGPINFPTAAHLAVGLVRHLAAMPPRTVLNCNVPNRPLDQLRGVRHAHLARSGLIRSALTDGLLARLHLEFGFDPNPPDDGTDEALTAAGFATVTPLLPATEDHETSSGAAFLAALDDVDASRRAREGPAA